MTSEPSTEGSRAAPAATPVEVPGDRRPPAAEVVTPATGHAPHPPAQAPTGVAVVTVRPVSAATGEQRRIAQMERLAQAALAMTRAQTVEELLRLSTHAAQDVVGAHQAVTTRLRDGWADATTYVSLSEKYADYASYDVVPRGLGVLNFVTRENLPLRLTSAQMHAHPDWRGLADAPGHPPLPNYLAAPLVAADGRNLGLIQLSDKVDDSDFDSADEAVLVQIAQGVAAAVERIELLLRQSRTVSRLTLALHAGHMGVWEWEMESGVVRWSETLEEIYGLEPGTFGGTVQHYAAQIHPEDRDAAWAAARDAAAAERRFDYAYRIVRPDGAVRWIQGAGEPMRRDDGSMLGMTGVCVDVTDRHLADESLRREHRIAETLFGVSQAIASQVELQDVVQVVTDAGTQLTGAQFGAFFYNVTESATGEVLPLYTLSGAPRSAFADFPLPRNTKVFAPTFAGEGVVRVDDITADPRFGHNPPYHGMPDGHLPVRSYLAVPVTNAFSEVIGGLFFGHEDVGVFTEEHQRLAEGLASQAAIALGKATLYDELHRQLTEREHVAAVLQDSLLPPHLPDIDGVSLAARYLPGAERIGGDFYDVFPLAGRDWGIVVGDVCGKGPEAAALTALARHSVRTAAMFTSWPSEALGVLNEALARSDESERFCTAAFARLTVGEQRSRLLLALGGHPQVIVLRGDGTIAAAGQPGTLLGALPSVDLVDDLVELRPGDRVVFYTDGLLEARRGEAFFGEDGLQQLLTDCAGLSAEATADRIVETVDGYADRASRDDLALLVLSFD